MDVDSRKELRCGRFQIILVFLTQMVRFSVVWSIYILMFGSYEPPWRCIVMEIRDDRMIQNESSYHQSNLNYMNIINASYVMEGTDNHTAVTPLPYNGSCDVISSCGHVEFQPGSTTIVSEFGLICDQSWITSLILSVKLLGTVPGSYVGGQVAERLGRKIALYANGALLCVSVSLAVISPDWKVYTAFCFFIGFACGGVFSTCNVFTLEFLDSWWRAAFLSFPLWNASLVAFTIMVTWLKDWKLIHIASGAVSGLSFLGVIWVPESMRWLNIHGRKEEARRILERIKKFNKIDHSRPMVPVKNTLEDGKSNKINIQNDRRRTKYTTYLDLLKNSYIRGITWKAGTAWVLSHMAYISLGYGIDSLPGDFYTNAIVASVSEVPVILSIGPLANRFGRQKTAVSYLIPATVCCCLIVLVHYVMARNENRAMAITVLALVAKAFVSANWCLWITMLVELFPTVVRNLGYGFVNMASGIGGVLAPYLIPRNPSWFGVCFSILTAMLVISIVVTMLLPETKDKPLDDVIPTSHEEDADGDEDEDEDEEKEVKEEEQERNNLSKTKNELLNCNQISEIDIL